MSFWQYFSLFISVIVGGGIAFYLRRQSAAYLTLVLSFSGAYILGITVLHLLPSVFKGGEEQVGLWILAGFFVQLFLEQLSSGVEHGHIHAHQQAKPGFALQIMLGLCIHAFMEGMPLGNYQEFHQAVHGHVHDSDPLLAGIILHKAPAAFALVLLLLLSGFRNVFVFSCLIFFALMSPLGAATSDFLYSIGILKPEYLKIIVAIVIGSFLHIATTILFEVDDSNHHKIAWKKFIAIIIGIGVAIATMGH